MSKLPKWIRERNKREILAFVGAGMAALAAAGWAVFIYFDTPGYKITVSYTLCVGHEDSKKWCPAGSVFVLNQGENAASDWVANECKKYARKLFKVSHPSNECNCYVLSVLCAT